jgi:hypothetical protein
LNVEFRPDFEGDISIRDHHTKVDFAFVALQCVHKDIHFASCSL